MIKHLSNIEIDKRKWDECVQNSEDGLVYCLSWFLDIVTPGWEALVYGDYEYVFPLSVKKKFGFRYLIQPFFAQQFMVNGAGGHEGVYKDFIQYVHLKFRYVHLNIGNRLAEKGKGFIEKENSNYELVLNKPYAELYGAFSANNKKNIRSGKNKGLQIASCENAKEFYGFSRANLEGRIQNVTPFFWESMKDLANYVFENKIGEFLAVRSTEGETLAIGCFVLFKSRWYLMVNSTNETGRKKRAHYFMVNSFIEKYSGSDYILDFEGSNVESIAYFFKGFGAKRTCYYTFKVNRLPLFLKSLKK